jgi:peptide subunit release factor 1 (eRF1)
MYFVEDGTKKCGFYECRKCGYRFLAKETDNETECPDCASEWDPEIGPDEVMPENEKTAQLLQVIEGEEEVEKMDGLLSLAITGGDYSWI